MPVQDTPRIQIEPWADSDLGLLRRTNAPEMTEHLGGPESEAQILARHQRYLAMSEPGAGRMYRIALLPEREPVGSLGYWERVWREEPVYETGWMVLPPYQGRGIASTAMAAFIANVRAQRKHRHMHAFPSGGNPASNAICRKLGFTLLDACDFEYPPGNTMRCNNWRLDLSKTS